MKRKKNYLEYKKERAILSDVLPYETPVTFSNRGFYKFLLQNKVSYSDGKIKWKTDDRALEHIIKILFGIKHDEEVCCKTECHLGKEIKFSFIKVKPFSSIPFSYKISHKEKEYRELTICHPRSQLQLIDLYEKFKELILYYCSVSPFSIRQPAKIAKFIYYNDKTHHQRLSGDSDSIEEFNKEYENLRSFFSYKDYSNVYKFYESYKYHRCEQKYDAMMKLDISKCFDSIYTHSLAWALIGKEQVKENLRKLKGTFADHFDKFMQGANYQETNGIIIGPEFSRIFAELILQYIDKQLFVKLKKDKELIHKEHYEIFRYVDDYFIFYNKGADRDAIHQELQILLKEFKLSLNPSKADIYEKPIITSMSIAKLKISNLLNYKTTYRFDNVENMEESEETNRKDEAGDKKASVYVNSNKLITKFKAIIKECQVEYKDLLNYSLSVMESKSKKIIQEFGQSAKSEESEREKKIVKAILEILSFSFFIYSVSPRVNTTIRICRIIKIFIDFLTKKMENSELRHQVFQTIHNQILLILKKNKNSEYTQVETLYLLVVVAELGKHYGLEESELSSYFGIREDERGELKSEYPLNYFSFTVLLFYIRDKRRYERLRCFIKNQLCKKFDGKISVLRKTTELTLLLFDILACPHVCVKVKKSLLDKYKIYEEVQKNEIIAKINEHKYWFTNWLDNFNLAKELDAKRSSEVY